MKKTMIKRFVRVRTKNFTAKPLRGTMVFPIRSIVRLGSLTPTERIFPSAIGKYKILEVNKVGAVENSRDKLLMKQCFDKAEIKHAKWWWDKKGINLDNTDGHVRDSTFIDDDYPVVVKLRNGFQGHGMRLVSILDNEHINPEYIIEKYYNYAREYRLHCTQTECFMSWRKLRRADAKERWFFNSENCNWVSPEHELFDRPSNWDEIVDHSIRAMKAVGLDIGAVDVRVQSSKHEHPDFIICEVNSAPALGEVGVDMYKEQIIKILHSKLK